VTLVIPVSLVASRKTLHRRGESAISRRGGASQVEIVSNAYIPLIPFHTGLPSEPLISDFQVCSTSETTLLGIGT
jgi:hypothetical protein